MMKVLKGIFSFLILSIAAISYGQQRHPLLVEDAIHQKKWVDSVYSQMTVNQRIGQLFMVDVFSRDPKVKTDRVKELIANYHIGGVIFSKGGPVRQARLNNELQAASKLPLLVAMDAEWGLNMRLDSTYAFPWNMTLGAIKDNRIIEEVGAQIGKHCKRLGVHINFAPDVDINVNPANPIIGNRSFGEDRINVTEKSIAFTKGMQSVGVLGSAKHFPGHGDTDKDSHKTLPTIPWGRKRLDSIEMFPYRPIIDAGIASIMVAHLNVPSLVPEKGYPTSISPTVINKILRDSLNFKGLIFTDALNMKGAADFKDPGDIDLAAFKAGNDILLISNDVPSAHKKIKEALVKGEISEQRLALSVKKILYAKYKVGLHQYTPVVIDNIVDDLNTVADDLVYSKAISHAITVAKNSNALVPIHTIATQKIAYLPMGDASGASFHTALKKYADVKKITGKTLPAILNQLTPFDVVIIGFHRSNANPWKDYKFTQEQKKWLYEIAKHKKVILDLFVRPYAMLDIHTTKDIEVIIHSYQNSKLSQEKSAQIIFGALKSRGLLPVSLGDGYPIGIGYQSGTFRRLKYGIPESVGINGVTLNHKIDSLVTIGLNAKMMPGAQILVAKDGKVVFNKNYGYQTYNKQHKITDNSIYDVASMTKILASLPLLMELHHKKKIKLDTTIGALLPEFRGTNKAHIKLKRALTHTAQLRSWIPFYISTLDSVTKKPLPAYYNTYKNADYNIKITDKMYLRSDYQDSIMHRITNSDLREHKGYKYSDLPYYITKKYIEKFYGSNLDALTQDRFYKSIGAYKTGYLPLEKFDKQQIVPSEKDTYWRHDIVKGTVHDMGAAMQGGIGGHAGLFSTANDVAKLMQLYLQNGYYGGRRYFGKSTMDAFNNCAYCHEEVRRGIGFDKPQLEGEGPTCGCVPMSSFGHSGFTGTYTWADPENKLIYVFLSNRTFPTMENRALVKSSLRTKIQEAIYQSLE